MRKIILLVVILILINYSLVNAEIRTSHDDFSGMSLAISETMNIDQFNSVKLFKQINPNKDTASALLIKCQSKSPAYFKDKAADIKVDDNMYILDCIAPKARLNNDGTGNEAYETFDVTQEMLAEWKQVINM